MRMKPEVVFGFELDMKEKEADRIIRQLLAKTIRNDFSALDGASEDERRSLMRIRT